MKKRIISLLLSVLLVVGMIVPATTIESDAVIGSLIKVGLTVCKSVVNGTIKTVKNVDHYDGNVGKCVLGQLKNIAADLTGLDIGEDYGEDTNYGETASTTVVNVDLSTVEAELKNINAALEKNNIAIHQLEQTVIDGIESLSDQMDELKKYIKDTGTELKYNDYLTEFFAFFNQYYEAIGYYEELLSDTLNTTGHSDAYLKNTFDQFYHLQNVEYTGNLHSAVDKLGRYLRGEYLSADYGSVVDVLAKYYYLAYSGQTGVTEYDAYKKAATDTEEMVAHFYYAYCMGVYYEQTITLFQSTYMDTHDTSEYVTDYGTYISETQLVKNLQTLLTNTTGTAGGILKSLLSNYPNEALDYTYVDATGAYYSANAKPTEAINLYPGEKIYFGEIAYAVFGEFSSDLRDAFVGLTTAPKSDESGYYTSSDDNTVQNLDFTIGEQKVATVKVNVKSNPTGAPFRYGQGTKEIPYGISTAADFNNISKYPDKHYILLNDINFNGYAITPIDVFSGTLDGNGYTLKNGKVRVLTATSTIYEKTVNLFYPNQYAKVIGAGIINVLTGTVQDLRIEEFNINVDVAYYKDNETNPCALAVGGLVGYVAPHGEIHRVVVSGGHYDSSVTELSSPGVTITAEGNIGSSSFENYVYVGGIAGLTDINATEIAGCIVEGARIYASSPNGNAAAGGIVGNSQGKITRCVFVPTVNDTQASLTAQGYKSSMMGGIAGMARSSYAEVSYCTVVLPSSANITETDIDKVRYALYFGDQQFYYESFTAYRGMVFGASNAPVVKSTDDASDKGRIYSFNIVKLHSDTTDQTTAMSFIGNQTDPTGYTSVKLHYGELVYDSFDAAAAYAKLRMGAASNTKYIYTLSGKTLDIKYDYEVGGAIQGTFKSTYTAGEYFSPAGLEVYLYNRVNDDSYAGDTYDTVGKYNSLTAHWHFSDETLELISRPLTAGKHTLKVEFENGATASFDITVYAYHTFVEQLVAPTCTEDGSRKLICVDCGLEKDATTVPKLGHHEVKDPAVSPTCSTDGKTEGSHCDRCGEVIVEQQNVGSTGEHGHTIIAGYAPTCTTDGLTDKDYCEGCGLVHTEATVIPATGHNMKSYVILEPTCTNAGIIQDKCKTCGAYGDFATTPALEHSYKDTVVAPTCTQAGYTIHTCEHCGLVYTEADTAPATGHTMKSYVVLEPTCTNAGIIQDKCETCGAYGDFTTVPALEHSYKDTVVSPTCNQAGYTIHTCEHCGTSHISDVIAGGHDWQAKTVAPTHTEVGYTVYTCSHCGETYRSDYTAPVGHTFGEGTVTKEATCTAEGEMKYACSCGNSHTVVIVKTEHDMTDTITGATCTEMGYTTHKCAHCDYSYIDSYTSTAAHSLKNTITDATCTDFGYTTHRCEHCDYSYIDNYRSPASHSLKSTVTDPTCIQMGYTTHKCEHCDYSYIDSYTATAAHSLKNVVTDPTCTEFGYTTHKCRNCGYSYVESYTAPVGHTYDESTATCLHKAKCTVCGVECGELNEHNHESEGDWSKTAKYHTVKYSCCGYAQTEKEEHTWKDGACEQCGYACIHEGGIATCCEQAVCDTCGAHYGELDPNVHTDLYHVAEREATSDAEGNIEYWHCADCDKYYSDRAASTQITEAQSITAKLPRDYTELVLWLVPIVLNAAVIIMLICVLSKRKKKA